MIPIMGKSQYHKVVWVYGEDFRQREIPLVFLANGLPGYVINQWIFFLVSQNISQSKLDLYISSVMQFYDLCIAVHGNHPLSEIDNERLMILYRDARMLGTDCFCAKKRDSLLTNLGLYWVPTNLENIKRNVKAFGKFDNFQQTYHYATAINPSEKVFMTVYETYTDFVRRTKWDVYLHLFKSRSHQKNVSRLLLESEGPRENKNSRNRRKAFPLNRFVELVESAPNPRDKMFLLLMGGGSLRMSETLHILFPDIEGCDQIGQAKVRLDHPKSGNIEWYDNNNNRCSGKREEYFKRQWQNNHFSVGHPLRGLMPRTLYGKRRRGLQSGWKGMTFHESDGTERFLDINGRPYDVHHVFWIDTQIGAYFFKCFEEYMNKFVYNNPFTGKPNPKGFPWHPWLFISLKKETYGEPFTYTALEKMWDRRMAKIGLSKMALGEHSLRHLYGYYCANVLRVDIAKTQIYMHHSSVDSTQVYYNVSNETVRQELTKASLRSKGIDPGFLITPGTPRISFPHTWTTIQYDNTIKSLGT